MTLGIVAVAALLFGTTAPVSAAAAAPTAFAQQHGTLPRGGSYVLDPDPTVAAAAVELWFRAPGAGYDNAVPGVSRVAATAAAAAGLTSGKSLVELVRSLGGDLTINVYPDIVGIGAYVPAPAVRRVVAAMTAAYFTPDIDDAAIKTAQRDAAVLAVQQRYSADQTLHDLLFERMFTDGPAHYPPLPDSVAALTHISLGEVTAFAKRAFRSSNAVLTLAGNVDASSIDAITAGEGSGSMDAPYVSTTAGTATSTAVSGTVGGLGLAWVGPPIADEKAATALDFVADYLFREDTGVVSKALNEATGNAYVLGQFITLNDPGVMLVTIGGDQENATKQRVLDAVAQVEQPLDERTFEAAREAFLYHLAYDMQTPQEMADNLGWYTVEGGASYAPGNAAGTYERIARSLDPQYVAQTVRRYLSKPFVVNLVSAPATKESAS
ncbi:MAG TPA: insulinase family protein [Candidatus Baltobacteraceae bacterium]|nr:insulinase family protein [Candidatus Baltobacteraceae bacterium]